MRSMILGAAALALAGCVSTSTAMLDERTAIISGRGSGYSSAADVQQRVILEAATAARARGFRYFVIQSATDQSRSGRMYFPGQTNTYGQGTATCTGNFCSGTYSGQTYSTPAQAFDYVRPGQDVQIRFYREGEINPKAANVWDAVSIMAAQAK